MTKNEIYELMNQNPGFHMATCEYDQPRVRGMFQYKADESGGAIVCEQRAFGMLSRKILREQT